MFVYLKTNIFMFIKITPSKCFAYFFTLLKTMVKAVYCALHHVLRYCHNSLTDSRFKFKALVVGGCFIMLKPYILYSNAILVQFWHTDVMQCEYIVFRIHITACQCASKKYGLIAPHYIRCSQWRATLRSYRGLISNQ